MDLRVTIMLNSRYPESRHHFLHSSDGAGFGRMMADFHVERGYARETGTEFKVLKNWLRYQNIKKKPKCKKLQIISGFKR